MAKAKLNLDEYQPDAKLVDERGATQERHKKAGGGTFRDDKGREHMRDSPINVAMSRRQITSQQYTAAQKFYAHWFRAGLLESFGSADMNRVFGGEGSSGGMAKTEAQAFHRQQYRKAVDILGRVGAWTLLRVVCAEQSFEDTGRAMGWNNRPQAVACAVQRTREALDVLCAEWGIIE